MKGASWELLKDKVSLNSSLCVGPDPHVFIVPYRMVGSRKQPTKEDHLPSSSVATNVAPVVSC